MKMNVKGNDNFRTPQRLYDQLDKIFNFTLDAACTKEDCKAPRGLYHDEGVDALACSWGGNVYSAIHHLAKRLNLSQRHIMKLSTANAPLSLWCCLQTVRTAAPSSSILKSNSFTKHLPDVCRLLTRKQESRNKAITPEQLLSILRRI